MPKMPKMPNSNAEVLKIAEILTSRRKQIDREVAEFKAEKEKDYIAFEQKLRAEGPDNDSQQQSRTMFKAKDVDKRREEFHGTDEEQGSNISIAKGSNAIGGRSDLASSATNDLEIYPRTPGSSIHVQEKGPESRNITGSLSAPLFHERETEFQGLFTPSYLPLLESSANKKMHESKKPSLTLSIKPDELATPIPDSTPALSSSSPVPASARSSSTSLPTPGHTPSGVPREISLGLRRSSSRSDTSIASLRSSLRHPNQPRSPKRVLFSIDNVVVSPSTSPIAQRSQSAPQSKPPGLDNPQDSEKAAASKNKEGYYGVGARNSGVEPYSQSNSTRRAPSFGPLEGKDLKYGPIYHPRDVTHSSALTGGDDSEGVGFGDDLFAFDEDMDIGELEHAHKDIGNFGSDEEEDETKDTNPSSSPHAGSLPIEIKWPARHDPRA